MGRKDGVETRERQVNKNKNSAQETDLDVSPKPEACATGTKAAVARTAMMARAVRMVVGSDCLDLRL
jgi:hypothetical protein